LGNLSAQKQKRKIFYRHYVEHYNAIELNAIHYKIYGEREFRNGAEKAKDKDLFLPKITKESLIFGSLKEKNYHE